jgi:hypothetical protein
MGKQAKELLLHWKSLCLLFSLHYLVVAIYFRGKPCPIAYSSEIGHVSGAKQAIRPAKSATL